MIEIDPLRAAGPVLLGSTREAAGEALRAWGDPEPYAPYPGALPLDWRINGASGVDAVVHCGSTGVVQTIEIDLDFGVRPRAQALLLGQDMFSVPAEQMLAILRERFEVEEAGDGYTVPALSLGMGRRLSAEDFDEEGDGYSFDNFLLAGPGYYDPPPRRSAGGDHGS
ncbi:hypothetical protein [Actinomadura alba]|uniref:Uncharacterized protein n=2 Tax=Actinomadura alba TaxID=406431 RepID=A0ABR7LP09_9ACTN|nr:hypothetical protein [Actinomadura alba]MBC6466304.1 hypothetical protein [Actinomadura alba]